MLSSLCSTGTRRLPSVCFGQGELSSPPLSVARWMREHAGIRDTKTRAWAFRLSSSCLSSVSHACCKWLPPPAVPYHTPLRARLSTPNNDPVARNAQYITNKNVVRAAFDKFLSLPRVEIGPVSRNTGPFYATVYNFCRAQGRPIPTNDLWIAATALETGAVVLTSDAHLLQLPLLRVEPV